MKRAILTCVLIAPLVGRAGEVSPSMVWTSTAPSGSCKGSRVVFVLPAGTAYCCSGTTWGTCSGVYTLPPASATTLGGVKGFTNLTIGGDGSLSLTDANVKAALLAPIYRTADSISSSGDVDNVKSGQTFAYPGSSSPVAGGFLSFGGLGGNYETQIVGAYNDATGALYFRTHNGDTSTWNAWRSIWHSGNFDPTSKLGVSAQAADSALLQGHAASYFQTALGFTPAPQTSGTGLLLPNGSGGFTSYGGTGSCASHTWMFSLSSTGGAGCSRPDYSDLTGTPSIPAASTTTPSMDGSASYGSGTTWARADHVHPTDTSRAPTASPTFTGTVTNPLKVYGKNYAQTGTDGSQVSYVNTDITAELGVSPGVYDVSVVAGLANASGVYSAVYAGVLLISGSAGDGKTYLSLTQVASLVQVSTLTVSATWYDTVGASELGASASGVSTNVVRIKVGNYQSAGIIGQNQFVRITKRDGNA